MAYQLHRSTVGCGPVAVRAAALALLLLLPATALKAEPLEPLELANPAPQNRPAVSTPTADSYRLGAGDVIHLEIFDVPEHSGEKRVLVDGSLNLNWVGNVSVAGMTSEQAASAIALAYSPYLRDPLITVSLVTPRPLQISIAGAVNRPGAYTVDFSAAEEAGGSIEMRWPTVTQALQQAGGITQVANVREVTVQRRSGQGELKTLQVNLWDLLQTGDVEENITLRDGDAIYVPVATEIDPAEARELSTASFSPATITVNVVGEVTSPGVVEVPPNTPLNQALLAAGGFDNARAQTGSVELIRLNPDGSVSQRQIAINLEQGIDEASNPIVHPNDVIIVNRSNSTRVYDSLTGGIGAAITGLLVPWIELFTD